MMVENLEEGAVIIPRRIGFLAIAGGVVFLVTQVYAYATVSAQNAAEFAAINRQFIDGRIRGDEIRRRIAELEASRSQIAERLTRMEERLTSQTELLRAIREDTRRDRP
jgi:hypothetical protein